MRNFPKYAGHEKVVCFNCAALLSNAVKTENACGRGQYAAKCERCDMRTWYDFTKAADALLAERRVS